MLMLFYADSNFYIYLYSYLILLPRCIECRAI